VPGEGLPAPDRRPGAGSTPGHRSPGIPTNHKARGGPGGCWPRVRHGPISQGAGPAPSGCPWPPAGCLPWWASRPTATRPGDHFPAPDPDHRPGCRRLPPAPGVTCLPEPLLWSVKTLPLAPRPARVVIGTREGPAGARSGPAAFQKQLFVGRMKPLDD